MISWISNTDDFLSSNKYQLFLVHKPSDFEEFWFEFWFEFRSEKQLTLSNVLELISTQCAFLLQVEMTSHDVDDDNGPPEYQKY